MTCVGSQRHKKNTRLFGVSSKMKVYSTVLVATVGFSTSADTRTHTLTSSQ